MRDGAIADRAVIGINSRSSSGPSGNLLTFIRPIKQNLTDIEFTEISQIQKVHTV